MSKKSQKGRLSLPKAGVSVENAAANMSVAAEEIRSGGISVEGIKGGPAVMHGNGAGYVGLDPARDSANYRPVVTAGAARSQGAAISVGDGEVSIVPDDSPDVTGFVVDIGEKVLSTDLVSLNLSQTGVSISNDGRMTLGMDAVLDLAATGFGITADELRARVEAGPVEEISADDLDLDGDAGDKDAILEAVRTGVSEHVGKRVMPGGNIEDFAERLTLAYVEARKKGFGPAAMMVSAATERPYIKAALDAVMGAK